VKKKERKKEPQKEEITLKEITTAKFSNNFSKKVPLPTEHVFTGVPKFS